MQLFVAHWPGDGPRPEYPAAAAGEAWLLDTCLRRLLITAAPLAGPATAGAEVFAGVAAYRFLLEFITGLHSAVPGETNVLGQFRQGWAARHAAHPATAAKLAPTVQALLDDSREIRRRHLQGIGGHSYGSLLRRLLRPGRDAAVLIVGGGALARSLWPFFRGAHTGVWTRRRVIDDLPVALRHFAPEQADAAAGWAQHVVLATPPAAASDAAWQARLALSRPRTVTHLGHRGPGRFRVPGAACQYFLDDLFALQRTQANVRSLQLARARADCAARAGTRAAAGSCTLQRARA